jgi:hypothetical protein
VSAKLIAPSDAGKSELILSHLPHKARVIDDLTTASLLNLLDVPRPPKWIVIPDLNKVISHKPTVANLTFATLLSFLAEGVTEIPGIDGPAKLKAKRVLARGITIAVLTALTPDMFFASRRQWKATGLLRRLVPIYYTYSKDTANKIQSSIRQGADALTYDKKTIVPIRARDVTIPAKLAADIERLSENVTIDQLRWTKPGAHHASGGDVPEPTSYIQAADFPFSVQKTLRQYIRACALLRDSRVVSRADWDLLLDFAAFVRYDRPERI